MKLTVQELALAICRLDPKAAIPAWADQSTFCCICRTSEELSIVTANDAVPADVKAERAWRSFKVEGPLDFALTGILSRIAAPLAIAEISIFAVSTFDTDYVLVRAERLDEAVATLRKAGFQVGLAAAQV